MISAPYLNSWGYFVANANTTDGTLIGTSVVPGASDAEGSATSILTAAAFDLFYVKLVVYGGGTASAIKCHLLDFGWDPAGGTSYTWFFQNLICGESGLMSTNGIPFHFPCNIPAGSQVAVRVQGNNATAETVTIYAEFYGKPSRPEMWQPAAYAETIGTITGSMGVAVVPANGSFGSYALLGTTVKPLNWWEFGVQENDSSMTGIAYIFELAVGDGTNYHTIMRKFGRPNTSETFAMSQSVTPYWAVPAGSNIYLRGYCSGAPDSNVNAVAVGFGG